MKTQTSTVGMILAVSALIASTAFAWSKIDERIESRRMERAIALQAQQSAAAMNAITQQYQRSMRGIVPPPPAQ